MNEEKIDLLTRLGEKARTALRLKEDSELIEGVVRGFNELHSKATICATVGKTLVDFDRKIAKLAEDADDSRRSRDPKLLEKQARWNADRGDDCEDPPSVFCPRQADQGDLP